MAKSSFSSPKIYSKQRWLGANERQPLRVPQSSSTEGQSAYLVAFLSMSISYKFKSPSILSS